MRNTKAKKNLHESLKSEFAGHGQCFFKGGLFYSFIEKLFPALFTLINCLTFRAYLALIHVHNNSNSTISLAVLKYYGAK